MQRRRKFSPNYAAGKTDGDKSWSVSAIGGNIVTIYGRDTAETPAFREAACRQMGLSRPGFKFSAVVLCGHWSDIRNLFPAVSQNQRLVLVDTFINILFCSDFVQLGVSQGSSQAGSRCL